MMSWWNWPLRLFQYTRIVVFLAIRRARSRFASLSQVVSHHGMPLASRRFDYLVLILLAVVPIQ